MAPEWRYESYLSACVEPGDSLEVRKCLLGNQWKKCPNYSVQTVSWSANMIAVRRVDHPSGGRFMLCSTTLGIPKIRAEVSQVPEPSFGP
jgi:hypothetical protein